MTRKITKEQLTKIVAAATIAESKVTNRAVIIPELITFQKLDGLLAKDGKYGPNSKKAIEWYTKKPAPNAVWSRNAKVTWIPPLVSKPYVSPPRSYNRSQLIPIITLALQSESQVRASKSPRIIQYVRNFQKKDGGLLVDGKWGPNTQAAAEWYTKKVMPAPMYSKTAEVTWIPPTIIPDAINLSGIKKPVVGATTSRIDLPVPPATKKAVKPLKFKKIVVPKKLVKAIKKKLPVIVAKAKQEKANVTSSKDAESNIVNSATGATKNIDALNQLNDAINSGGASVSEPSTDTAVETTETLVETPKKSKLPLILGGIGGIGALLYFSKKKAA